MFRTALLLSAPCLLIFPAGPLWAQQPVGHIDIASTAEKVRVSGAVTLSGTSTLLGNGAAVTAGTTTLPIHLTRGGTLDVCATTELHLAQQDNPADPDSALMLSLDHGAMEAHYSVGKNSDVVLTPDLRILLSGPGKADVRLRVSPQGDTCVDNRGGDAPYVTVSEQIGAGVYRVQPNQRVLFEHGSVREVVDNEPQPCGCPEPPVPVISVASAGHSGSTMQAAKPGQAAAKSVGGPSSTPADTAFPLAESEGLAPTPALPTKPVVPPGTVHAEVTTTLHFDAPTQAVPTGDPNGMATPESAATVATVPAPGFGDEGSSTSASASTAASPTTVAATAPSTVPAAVAQPPAVAPLPSPAAPPKSGFFHKLGRFFAKVFG